MSAPTPLYTQEQRQAAADWFVVIHAEEEPNGETLQSWLRWMDQHEGNRLAFEAIAQSWHEAAGAPVSSMPSRQELLADSYEGDRPVAEWLASHPRAASAGSRFNGDSAYRVIRNWRWRAAASLAAIAFGAMLMTRYVGDQGSQSDTFTTKNGEQIEITLEDGSKVWLGPKSHLSVDFTQRQRGLQLSAGEAFFAVKKDRSRPFVVRSSGGDITAVGTAFNVRAVQDHVTVTVSEGVVSVAPKNQLTLSHPAPVRVASGQQLTFAAQAPIEPAVIAQSATLDERARWRDGVLVYRNEPLRDVVMDVARYSDKELELSGEAIGAMRYSGVVYEGAVDEWLSALPESFPVKVVREGNREIISAR